MQRESLVKTVTSQTTELRIKEIGGSVSCPEWSVVRILGPYHAIMVVSFKLSITVSTHLGDSSEKDKLEVDQTVVVYYILNGQNGLYIEAIIALSSKLLITVNITLESNRRWWYIKS